MLALSLAVGYQLKCCHGCLIDTWSGMQQSVIDEAVGQWRKRLNACVKANGIL